MSDKDGGPAFPMTAGPEPRVDNYHEYQTGMSLRDYFAAHAPESARSHYEATSDKSWIEWQWKYADAMLKERARMSKDTEE